MYAQDFQQNTNSSPVVLGSGFTTEEAARLKSLRETFHAHAESLREFDERRLEFVRWLRETGRLNEQA